MPRYHALNEAERHILCAGGTEPPFSSSAEKREGIYLCRQCDAPLYLSSDRFDSRCGWPSFDDEIPGAIAHLPDREIRCVRCNGHLGHLFEGEHFTPKEKRHCVNALSLRFLPAHIDGLERAVFGAGCFWGVQRDLGYDVTSEVGYMGGDVVNPTYEEVCTGETGHTEVVHLLFDPKKIRYEHLIKRFYAIHDPCVQKCQYRSVIFYFTQAQKECAEKQQKGSTRILPASLFYRAEEHHQHYYSS